MCDYIQLLAGLTDEELFDDAVAKHLDISTVECIGLHPSITEFCEWSEHFQQICQISRKKWQGIHCISINYRDQTVGETSQDSLAVISVSSDSVSLSSAVLNFITEYITKLKAGDELGAEFKDPEIEESDDEEIVAPSEFVHIKVDHNEVQNWIKAFIQGKRNQINKQNIQNFCVDPEHRQNCARVDAVLVKRKGTSGHIKVQNIENYWVQEVKKFPHIGNAPVKEGLLPK